MRYSSDMQTIITHSSGFHADDVFAVATLQLHLGAENMNVVRTRDEEMIATGDWVVDVGGVYDPEAKRFDHHQNGAPIRENGIPYAAFGLVWKHIGTDVAGSADIADEIEKHFVMAIDANDNGVSLVTLSEHGIRPPTFSDMVGLFNPRRGSGEDLDAAFMEAVGVARRLIERAIVHATARAEMRHIANDVYERASDKQVLVFEEPMSRTHMIEYPEVLFMICPDDPATNTNWTATAIAKAKDTFETRMPFPEVWAGLRGEELAAASGIPDAIFCHRNRFLFVAASKEGVCAAVEKAMNA